MTAMDGRDRQSGGEVIDEELLNRLMNKVDAEGLELLGPDGVLTELTAKSCSGRWMSS
jgi:hypothetical protein